MVSRPSRALLIASSLDTIAADLLADGSELRIHSHFERALNLAAADGEILGIVGPRAGNGPATIVLRELPSSSLGDLVGPTGDRVHVIGGRLEVGAELCIDTSASRRWFRAGTRLTSPRDVVHARIRRSITIARSVGPAGGLAPLMDHLDEISAGRSLAADLHCADLVSRTAGARASELAAAWRAGDPVKVARAARLLAGLGPGLTPSGDDLLAGFIVGHSRVGPAARPDLAAACAAAAQGRTTDIGLARIRHAARDAIEEVQEDVLTAMLGPDANRLESTVTRAATWGHTSGMDTLVGLFLGVKLALAT